MVVKGRQYSCGGVGGEAIQLFMVVKERQYSRGGVGGQGKQYSCDGGEGKVI